MENNVNIPVENAVSVGLCMSQLENQSLFLPARKDLTPFCLWHLVTVTVSLGLHFSLLPWVDTYTSINPCALLETTSLEVLRLVIADIRFLSNAWNLFGNFYFIFLFYASWMIENIFFLPLFVWVNKPNQSTELGFWIHLLIGRSPIWVILGLSETANEFFCSLLLKWFCLLTVLYSWYLCLPDWRCSWIFRVSASDSVCLWSVQNGNGPVLLGAHHSSLVIPASSISILSADTLGGLVGHWS